MRIFKILSTASFAGTILSMGILYSSIPGICALLFFLSALGYAVTKKYQEYKFIDYTKELHTPKFSLKSFIKDYNCLLLLILLFVLYAFGILYSTDKDVAIYTLGNKLSLLAFPVAFILLGKNFINKKMLIIWACSLILSCCIISIYHIYILYTSAMEVFGKENLLPFINETFHTRAWLTQRHPNKLIHSAYESQLMILSIYTIIITWIKRPAIFRKIYVKLIAILALIILISAIVVSSSKSGQTFFLLSMVGTAIYLLYRKYYKTGITMVIIGIIAVTSIVHFVPGAYSGVKHALTTGIDFFKGDQNAAEGSIVARYYIWEAGIKTFLEKPILGYGSGGVNMAIGDNYDPVIKDKYLPRTFNAHNQFLQLLIELGIIGFSCFLTMYFIAIRLSFRKKDIIFLFFLSTCAWFMIFESMLEHQVGVIPFCALFSLLFCYNKQLLTPSKEDLSANSF